MQIFSKKKILSLFALLLPVLIALSGIWFNSLFSTLPSGESLTGKDPSLGVTLIGWEQLSEQEWQFILPASDTNEPLLLCFNGTSTGRPIGLSPSDASGELYPLASSPDATFIRVVSTREPQCWLMTASRAAAGLEFRTTLQLMTLTAFVTMFAVVLALFHYKRESDLGYFLLYLAVLVCWGVMILFFPASQSNWIRLMRRFFFSLTVIASVWLSAGLTQTRFFPAKKQHLTVLLFSLLYFVCSLSTNDLLRQTALVIGMLYCLLLLIHAYQNGLNSALLLLLPGAVTSGLRIWVLFPGIRQPFFVESFPFYLIRCARIFDLPFALGVMVFVCRRFALQFDRTEQLARELDERVNERTRALIEESEARKSMMLNIFHDLRSPLFAVSSGLETLESAPEALPALLPALRQRAEFLRRLTEDLFLAAKLEQKQIMLNEDHAFLNEDTAAVCAACQSEADKKGVQLHVDTAASLPVWGDSVRLEQIVQNLVTNAIHYTPAGGTITVTCKAEDGLAFVSVRDTGCGIAPQDQAAVFDRYFHTTANTKHDSTGLGLTIAQELAHLHHGEITLESEVGKGSCFTLKLPILSFARGADLPYYYSDEFY